MYRLELKSCRLAIQLRTGYFPDGRPRHRTFSLKNVNPDATAEALAAAVSAIAPLLAYPIESVRLVRRYVLVELAEDAREGVMIKKIEARTGGVEILEFKSGSDCAVVVLHEIYGINRHISNVCEKYHACGYDVYCPNLIGRSEPFDYAQREEAYGLLRSRGYEGLYEQVGRLTARIRSAYRRVVLLGFSVGATIAWVLSESGLYDGVVSYYGSRIRDNLHIEPKCPSLLIFAEEEPSFDPKKIRKDLEAKRDVAVVVLGGEHGFSDPFSASYDARSADTAKELVAGFLKKIEPI